MTVPLVPLRTLGEVRLGVKTFLNPFFYVDANRIAEHQIEPSFLEPIFTAKDVRDGSYHQSSRHTRLQLFRCSQDVRELAGSGAAAYIAWASKQRYKSEKRGSRDRGFWKDTPALDPHRRKWYINQAVPPPTRIMFRKLVDRTFAPLVLDHPIRVDQGFNQVVSRPGVSETALIGVLASTLLVMSLETLGSTSFGGGALQVPTELLRSVLVPDIRALSASEAPALEEATRALLKTKPRPSNLLRSNQAQRGLDELVLALVGISPQRLDELHEEAERLGDVRYLLRDARGTKRRERYKADVDAVAADIVAALRPLMDRNLFPDAYLAASAPVQLIQLGDGPLELQGELLLGVRDVIALRGSHILYRQELPELTAELFMRAVQVGRRTFNLPLRVEDASAALDRFDKLIGKANAELDAMSFGLAGHEGAVRERVEQELNLPLAMVATPLPPSYAEQWF